MLIQNQAGEVLDANRLVDASRHARVLGNQPDHATHIHTQAGGNKMQPQGHTQRNQCDSWAGPTMKQKVDRHVKKSVTTTTFHKDSLTFKHFLRSVDMSS